MQELFDRILHYFTKDIWEPGRGDFWGAVMSTIIIGIFIVFKNRLLKTLGFIWRFGERQVIIPKSLRSYKKALDEETLKLNHSWKLEGQSLKQLIVPVNVHETDNSNRVALADYIKEYNTRDKPLRLLILGDAGSGKSVSLGVLARSVWALERDKLLLPVLITFSDIKSIKTDEEFEAVITQILERHQFGQGKKNRRADNYVRENLYEGNILVLIDGLDELEKTVRFETARFINKFFQTHQSIPFAFTSRIAVWKQNPTIFNSLNFQTFYVSEFTPLEIRQYLSQWEFAGEKSGDQLAMLINSKSYLRSLATNPLILTIISFLYAQPKRILPDNRVQFYKECIDALMEKWDNAKSIDRANQFETIDKITILSRLAYQHITDSGKTDEDILKTKILDIIEEEMKALSRPVEKREKMLAEIVQNAELLVELPPDSYKFPHRTFLEYFAANYFLEKNKHQELLVLYNKDKGKWQETLALFCGMNVNQEVSDTTLKKLKQNFEATAQSANPDIFIFKALTESARITPSLANQILDLADGFLRQNINREIIEHLGYISINPNWSHATKAKKILLSLLRADLPDKSFEQVLLSLVHLSDPLIKETIIRHLNRINIQKLLITTGREVEEYTIRLLENIPMNRLIEVFEGLRVAGEIELLTKLMIKSNLSVIQRQAAFALVKTSKSDIFWRMVEKASLKDLAHPLVAEVDRLYKQYTWPKKIPRNIVGQKVIFLICKLTADYAIAENFSTHFNLAKPEMHDWFKYLITGILQERGHQSHASGLLKDNPKATHLGLIKHWKKRANYSPILPQVILLFIAYPLVNIIGFFTTNSLSLTITGIGCFTSIAATIAYLIIERLEGKKFYKVIRTTLSVLLVIGSPALFILLMGRFRTKMASEIALHLLMSIILIATLYLIPMPSTYKVINVSIVCLFTPFAIFNSFVSPLSRIIPCDPIKEMLD